MATLFYKVREFIIPSIYECRNKCFLCIQYNSFLAMGAPTTSPPPFSAGTRLCPIMVR